MNAWRCILIFQFLTVISQNSTILLSYHRYHPYSEFKSMKFQSHTVVTLQCENKIFRAPTISCFVYKQILCTTSLKRAWSGNMNAQRCILIFQFLTAISQNSIIQVLSYHRYHPYSEFNAVEFQSHTVVTLQSENKIFMDPAPSCFVYKQIICTSLLKQAWSSNMNSWHCILIFQFLAVISQNSIIQVLSYHSYHPYSEFNAMEFKSHTVVTSHCENRIFRAPATSCFVYKQILCTTLLKQAWSSNMNPWQCISIFQCLTAISRI